MSSEGQQPARHGRPRGRRRWLLAIVAVAMAVVAGAVAFFARDRGAGTGGPALLQLRSVQAAADDARADLAIAPGAPGAAGYETSRPLSADPPAPQPVWRFARQRVPDADLARLARALGLAADEPAERDNVRWITDGGRKLEVAGIRGAPWRFVEAAHALCPPPLPGGSPDGVTSCAMPVPTERRAPTAQHARALAAPVLRAVGLSPDGARVQINAGNAQVTVDPVIAGLPTSGWSTTVTVSAAGIVQATGWLGSPEQGAAYPVVSAQEAFERLREAPVPLGAAEPAWAPDQPAGDSAAQPARITTAKLGLVLDWEGSSGQNPLLVPAWLFEVEGQQTPVAVIAIDQDYLIPPSRGG